MKTKTTLLWSLLATVLWIGFCYATPHLIQGTGVGVGIPGGTDTDVLFVDGTGLGQDAEFTYNKTTNTLDLGTTTAGGNLNVNATLGTELITAPMVTGGWTLGYNTGGWAITAGVLSKTASTGTLTATAVTGMTSAPTAGVTYKVVIVSSAASGSTTYTLGGVTGTAISTATTTTDYITASTTAKIIFSGVAASTISISSVSVKALTDATGDLTVDGNVKARSGIQANGTVGIGTKTPLAPLHVGNGITNNSSDSQVLISRLVDDTVSGNGHAFSDSSSITRSGTAAYNSFDGRVVFSGTNDYDHYASFQSIPTYSSSGTIGRVYGLYSGLTATTGTVSNYYGAYIANPTGAGTFTKKYALTTEAGSGPVGIGITNPAFDLDVLSTAITVAQFKSSNVNPYIRLWNSVAGGGSWSMYFCGTGGIFPAGSLTFYDNTNPVLILGASGNIGLNQTTFGTSAAKVLAIGAGTAPTTSPADASQVWVADWNAQTGQATLRTRDENGTNGAIFPVGHFPVVNAADNATLTADQMKGTKIYVSAAKTLTLQPVSAMSIGDCFEARATTTGEIILRPNGADRIILNDGTAGTDTFGIKCTGKSCETQLCVDSADGFSMWHTFGTWTLETW